MNQLEIVEFFMVNPEDRQLQIAKDTVQETRRLVEFRLTIKLTSKFYSEINLTIHQSINQLIY